MPSVLCIHHAPCNDGAAAAAALAYRLIEQQSSAPLVSEPVDPGRTIEVMPLTFGKDWDAPIDEDYIEHLGHHTDVVEEIYIVDISLSRIRYDQIIEELRLRGRIGETMPRITCIDHHRSAIDRLVEIESYCDETYIQIGPGLSGATLVWKYFNEKNETSSLPLPLLLQYVADQDIWEWKLPGSKEVNSALNTLDGMMPTLWQELLESISDPEEWLARRTAQGDSILSVVNSQVRRAFGATSRHVSTDGIEYMIVNATTNSSEIGNRLCEDSEKSPDCVAMIFSVLDDWSVKVSVRTVSGGKVAARTVAERFGGGGHDNAAGCRFASIEELKSAIHDLVRIGVVSS